MTEWPAASIPPGASTDAEKLVGRVARDSMQRGEPILESRLAPVGTKGGLSAVVAEGKRAMTVRVNDVIGVAGFALPGTFVDVMVNTQGEGGKNNDRDRTISKIVLDRILVLAVAQDVTTSDNKPRVVSAVTLEVTPQQAEQIDLARSIGSLSLVLRNQVDKASSTTLGARKGDLLKMRAVMADAPIVAASEARPVAAAHPAIRPVPRRAPAAAVPEAEKVEVIRGLKKSVE